MRSRDNIKRGVVLSGGGARGAYEIGVVKYILGDLADELGRRLSFDIIAGTSVGALNGAWMAATADAPGKGIRALDANWRKLEAQHFFHLSYSEILRVSRALMGGQDTRLYTPRKDTGGRMGGLLNTAPIDTVVRKKLPWHRITPNISSGAVTALSITTTEIATGKTCIFAQMRPENMPADWTLDPRRKAVFCEITSRHALASAAIPFLFPAVEIDGKFYSDGFLRQNTPLSPALRLGSDRVLILGLRSQPEIDAEASVPLPELEEYPGAFKLLGRLLDTMLQNPLEYDLQMLESFNQLIDAAESDYSPAFAEKLNRLMREVRGAGLKHVDYVMLRPSRDIGRLAADYMRGLPEDAWGTGPAAGIIKRLFDPESDRADLLSYILFDGDYAGELVDMGYEDAKAEREQLVEFFS